MPPLPIYSTRVFVSAASGWEIATKVRLGKLPHRDPFDRLLAAQTELGHLTLLSRPPRTAGVG
jgi:PIN domain nuclease of toxin-antitoxin system